MKTFKDLKFKERPLENGKQAKMFFSNGYGVSVIRFKTLVGYGSYTRNENEWELAVLKGTEDKWEITYETDITDDVIGNLSEDEVTKIMKEVQLLKNE